MKMAPLLLSLPAVSSILYTTYGIVEVYLSFLASADGDIPTHPPTCNEVNGAKARQWRLSTVSTGGVKLII